MKEEQIDWEGEDTGMDSGQIVIESRLESVNTVRQRADSLRSGERLEGKV